MPKLFPESNLEFGRLPDPDFVYAWNYFRFARSERNRAWLKLEKPALEDFLKEYPLDHSILELGVGAGNLTNLLLDLGFSERNIAGIDPNQYLLNKYAKEHPEAKAIATSITRLNPNFSRPFDLILAHMMLNYVPEKDLEGAFLEVFSVLRKGGDFLFMIPDPLEKAMKYHFDLEEENMTVTELAPWGGNIDYHHHSFEQLKLLLEKTGFSDVEILYRPIYGDPLNTYGYEGWAISVYLLIEHDIYENFSKRILVRAKKK